MNDLSQLDAAVAGARTEKARPTLVIVRSHIGYGSPKQGDATAHGAPLGADAIEAARERLGWPHPPFAIPHAVYNHWRGLVAGRAAARERWQAAWRSYADAYPELAAELGRSMAGRLPEGPLLCDAADRWVDADWVFVYTREAHPGEYVGHHDSFETKLAHARLLREEVGIRRPILVDDLAGTAHRAYGLLPNMTWVVGRGGRLIYKSDWTSAGNVESFLARFEQGRSRRPASGTVAAYVTEQIEFRDVDREAFYDRLRRNGPRAYAEFRRAEELWRSRG